MSIHGEYSPDNEYNKIEMKLLRPDQRRFVNKFLKKGYKIYKYSGLNMGGKFCPATNASYSALLTPGKFRAENVGSHYIIYLP